MHSEIDEPEIPSGVAIIGSDDETGTLFMSYFDERGVSRRDDIEVGDRRLTWRRDHPKFRQTMMIAADETGDRLAAEARMALDDGDWEDDFALTYERLPD